MNNFKVGARVIVTSENPGFHTARKGMTGTIKGSTKSSIGIVYAVEFDEAYVGGHTCCFKTKPEHGQWLRAKDMKLLDGESKSDNWKIVILPDGDKTNARLYENGKLTKSMTVQRYHADTYDRFVAADEAVKKLFGKQDKPEQEKPKGFTGKAVCNDVFIFFSRGKVYEFRDGHTIDDSGKLRPDASIKDHQIDGWIDKHFIRVVE